MSRKTLVSSLGIATLVAIAVIVLILVRASPSKDHWIHVSVRTSEMRAQAHGQACVNTASNLIYSIVNELDNGGADSIANAVSDLAGDLQEYPNKIGSAVQAVAAPFISSLGGGSSDVVQSHLKEIRAECDYYVSKTWVPAGKISATAALLAHTPSALDGNFGQFSVTLDPLTDALFAVNGQWLLEIDSSSGEIRDKVHFNESIVDPLTLSPNGQTVYVLLKSVTGSSGELIALSASSLAQVGSLRIEGLPHEFAFGSSSKFAYMTFSRNSNTSWLAKLNVRKMVVTAETTVGAVAPQMAVLPRNRVALIESNGLPSGPTSLEYFASTTLTRLRATSLPSSFSGAQMFFLTKTNALVGNSTFSNTLFSLNPRTNAVNWSWKINHGAVSVAFSGDQRYVYVVAGNTIGVYQASTGDVIGAIGSYSDVGMDDLAFDSKSGTLFVEMEASYRHLGPRAFVLAISVPKKWQ